MINKELEGIIDEVDQKFKCIQIDFEDASWRRDIPSEPGWYLIKTNTPISVLASVEPPQYKAHINIPNTLSNSSLLIDIGIAITQSDNEDYVVYNGETENLKSRAREHEGGHPKTNCLGLSNYESLRSYRWIFCYVAISSCSLPRNRDKLLRLSVEQGWRVKNGWPILCRR
jgi:hypothetical protein